MLVKQNILFTVTYHYVYNTMQTNSNLDHW